VTSSPEVTCFGSSSEAVRDISSSFVLTKSVSERQDMELGCREIKHADSVTHLVTSLPLCDQQGGIHHQYSQAERRYGKFPASSSVTTRT
jgi:hypothetical protein